MRATQYCVTISAPHTTLLPGPYVSSALAAGGWRAAADCASVCALAAVGRGRGSSTLISRSKDYKKRSSLASRESTLRDVRERASGESFRLSELSRVVCDCVLVTGDSLCLIDT